MHCPLGPQELNVPRTVSSHAGFPLGLEGRLHPEHDPPRDRPFRGAEQAHLFPIFFLHTMHTFSSVMMHFTCWCKIRSSWTGEGREIGGEVPWSSRQRSLLLKHLQLNVKLVKAALKGTQRSAFFVQKTMCNRLVLQSTSLPYSLQGSYPQELCMEQVLEHLVEPFLLCIFFQDFFQKDAYVINLSVCWQKVEGLGTGTEMGTE